MPLPLIIGAVALGTAAYGAYKGVSGAMDHSDASDTNNEARSIVHGARRELDKQREATNDTLTDYGERKLRAFNGTIEDFIKTFGRLKNVDIINTPELDQLNLGDFSTVSLAGLRHDYQALQEAGLGLGAGLGSGAALAFGAYNGTMLLATAGTGTAISGLGGVAATNATLAWLGGGTLASGGMGVAGGMMVLGGIVAGPALAIFGHIVGNSGEAALNDARGNKERAQTFSKAAGLAREKLLAVQQVTDLANNTFSKLSARLRHAVRDMKTAIDTFGEDYQAIPAEYREAVFRAVKFAQLVKAMIDAPILDTEGNLVLATEKQVRTIGDLAEIKLSATSAAPNDLVSSNTNSESASELPRNSAFMKTLSPSAALAAVVGSESLTRDEVVKRLWDYIKANKLEDEHNKRMINSDPKLKKIFGKQRVSMFEMAGLISKHLD